MERQPPTQPPTQSPAKSPVQATALPSEASVVVIGGGVMGCSTLYHLAKAGVGDAILIERNKLTSGTTWHSAAQVRALRSTRNLTDLVRYSIDLYSRLEQETGQQVGWINKGSLSIATNEDRMIHIRRQAALAGLFGMRAETIVAGEAAERWPLMNADDVVGAVWSPDDGRVTGCWERTERSKASFNGTRSVCRNDSSEWHLRQTSYSRAAFSTTWPSRV